MPDIMANIKVKTIVVTFAAVTLSSYGLTNLIFAQGPPTLPVSLSGNEEVPPVQTEATGAAYIVQIGINNYREYIINASYIRRHSRTYTSWSKGRKRTSSIYAIQIRYAGE